MAGDERTVGLMALRPGVAADVFAFLSFDLDICLSAEGLILAPVGCLDSITPLWRHPRLEIDTAC